MPMSTQVHLLRALKVGEVRPRFDETINVDVACAATNVDLREPRRGKFREDLDYGTDRPGALRESPRHLRMRGLSPRKRTQCRVDQLLRSRSMTRSCSCHA